MSGIKQAAQDVKNTFFSGGPGTTGREVFEDSTASGPGQAYSGKTGHTGAGTGTTGGAPSLGSSGHHSSGLDASGAGAGTQYGQHGTSGDGLKSSGGAGTRGAGVDNAGTQYGAQHGSTGTGTGAGTGVSGTGIGATVGTAGATGAGGNSGSGQTPSGQYGSIAPVSSGAHTGQHSHGHHSHEGGGHIASAAGTGAAAAAGAGAASHGSHGSHGLSGLGSSGTGTGYPTERSSATEGVLSGPGSGVGGATGHTTGHGHGGQSGLTGQHTDRVGALGQDQALYERTTGSGPVTSGAAGTDRFDTDNRRDIGSGGAGAGYADGAEQETGRKAPGKESGGIAGVLGTSDKDFTGRDRLGTGAYADTHGQFQSNTSGPKGASALTGREGNPETNPIAQEKSKDTGVHPAAAVGKAPSPSSGATSGSPEKKKGFMDKVKEALA